MSRKNEKLFDELLEKAFTQQFEAEEAMNSNEEAEQKYPFTQKQLEDAYRLSDKRKRYMPKWTEYAQRAAVIALCACTVVCCIIMSRSAVQGGPDNDVVKEHPDDYNSVIFSHSVDEGEIDISKVTIKYIPSGFELKEDRSSRSAVSLTYENDKEEIIVIDIDESEKIWILSDTKDHDFSKHTISGYEAYISYNDDQQQGSVYFGNKDFTVAISGFTTKEELLKIAENIEIKE